MDLTMQRPKEKDGGDGVFKNGGSGCSGPNRERAMRCGSKSLRNPFFDPPRRSSSMTHFTVREHLGRLHPARLILYSIDFHDIERRRQAGAGDEAGTILAVRPTPWKPPAPRGGRWV
jgi:hypothetical protein